MTIRLHGQCRNRHTSIVHPDQLPTQATRRGPECLPGLLAGLGYALGHHAVVAAQAISHYSWWFTIGIVALSVLFTLRSQRRLMAAAAAPADEDGE